MSISSSKSDLANYGASLFLGLLGLDVHANLKVTPHFDLIQTFNVIP